MRDTVLVRASLAANNQVSLVAALLALALAGCLIRNASAGILENPGIPAAEKNNWLLVYQLAIPTYGDWNLNLIPYSVDNSASVADGSFDRVAYYLELTKPDNSVAWVYVSFDAAGFTNDASKIGVPNVASGELYQQNVANMNVYSNVVGVATGTGLNGGNLEFWPSNYGPSNTAGVPNASSSAWDFGDGGASKSAGHGSMQIHNHYVTPTSGQTVFAYNNWGAGLGLSELGIGNQPTGNPDWTFASNANSYSVRTLQIQVHDTTGAVPEPSTLLVWSGLGAMGLMMAWRRRNRAA